MIGRWIAGIVILVALLAAALSASSTANLAPHDTQLNDDFSLGVIATRASN